jgi:hypothetical protein
MQKYIIPAIKLLILVSKVNDKPFYEKLCSRGATSQRQLDGQGNGWTERTQHKSPGQRLCWT